MQQINECWFIVQTNPNCEAKAVAEIRRAGFRAYLPKRAVYHRRKDDRIPIKRWPAMVGYVFMRFPGKADWYSLRQCQGVRGLLYVDGTPYRLSRDEVAKIMAAQRKMQYDAANARALRRAWIRGERNTRRVLASERFQPGVRVHNVGVSIIARVIEVTKRGTVKAVVEGEGRDMPVEFTDVENLTIIDEQAEAA